MAVASKRLPENVGGDFFVDSTCIDCDTCRQIAPETFRDHGSASSVYQQPRTAREQLSALKALVACPTASIGTTAKHNVEAAVAAFPDRIDGEVYFCGFTSESSFGAWSYLIVRPGGGNVLVDSPRFTRPLVRRIDALGGVEVMLLTHRDDVADHKRFQSYYGATRVMHGSDNARSLGIERVIDGDDCRQLAPDLKAIPTPGHTRGHMVFLYRDKYLFTGDHLWWSPERKALGASKRVCWYSWPEQIRSMKKLLDYRFEWVLPGHGRIHGDTADAMRQQVEQCVREMAARP